MKKIFLTLLVLSVTLSSFAQEQKKERKQMHKQERVERSAEEMATLRTERMAAQLNLSDSQKDEVNSLFLQHAKERKAAMANRKENKEFKEERKQGHQRGMKARMENRKEMQDQLKTILTPAQYEKWETTRETRDQKKAHGKNKGKRTN